MRSFSFCCRHSDCWQYCLQNMSHGYESYLISEIAIFVLYNFTKMINISLQSKLLRKLLSLKEIKEIQDV